MYDMLKYYKETEEKENAVWKKKGVKQEIMDKELCASFKKYRRDEGKVIAKQDIKKILEGSMIETSEKRNQSAMSVPSPTDRTMTNYFKFARAKFSEEFCTVDKVQQTSER